MCGLPSPESRAWPGLEQLADRPGTSARFLILGSASPDLSRPSAESLAGRVSHYVLLGFLIREVGVENRNDLSKVGASREGFVLDQLLTHLRLEWRDVFVWATHAGAELDLLVFRGGERVGYEIKRTATPSTSKSMHSAIETLSLSRLDVIHAGAETFPLKENIRAVAFRDLLREVE